jgi:glycosyltransferase involved in cell wall biosynthesis
MAKFWVSIVVNNYNYGRFLKDSIESALNQTYAHIEVIVVDDGSTDCSRQIIASYGSRIIPVLKENGGQPSAFNAGFAASQGDIVIFLDADDMLFPSAAARVASVWHAGLAKVQYNLEMIDAKGERLGLKYLRAGLRPGSRGPRELLLETGSHLSPPTSGNAFARTVLTSVLPMPETEERYHADGYLLTLALLYGDVVWLEETLGSYRVHGSNAGFGREVIDAEYLRRCLRLDLQREELILSRAPRLGFKVRGGLVLRNYNHLRNRLASLRLTPDTHLLPGDRPLRLAQYGIRAVWRWPYFSWKGRMLWTVWFLSASLLPPRFARVLFSWALFPTRRPALLKYPSLA